MSTIASRGMVHRGDADRSRGWWDRRCSIATKLFARREEAATMIEYALLVFLIAAACVSGISFLGGTLPGVFFRVVNTISGGKS
jgi:Flp pilus assembly pilin Flp